ncbi:helix-turn-helix transcriptional regulator [Actinoallomurus sp. CA-150999]|uniref:helix-turn-helix transcriptional regulator n=1 Tax=Actinoallomurus sp. CA-150999 TaxID=3239887 RepID=UPI003D8D1C8E
MELLDSPVLVGRGEELGRLVAALRRADRRVVIIEGDAGIGKTRLITEALNAPDVDAGRVLCTRCPPVHTPFTLGALVEGISRRGIDGVALGALSGALRPLFPEWGDRLPPAPGPAEHSAMDRHRLFRALADLLLRLDLTTVVVDDLHWADETTFDFLIHLATMDDPGIGVVVGWRPDEIPDRDLAARLSRIAAGGGGYRLRLGPLDAGATDEFITSMLRRRDVPRSLAVHLHSRTQGVPLLIEEMVQTLYDRAGAAGFAGEWTAARVRALAPPPSLRDSVLARLDGISDAAVLAVQALAIVAVPTEEALVARVTDLGFETARAALSEATAANLLVVGPDRALSFRHALVLDAVDEQISPLLRPLLHERVAAALAESAQPPIGRLARHLKEAGDTAGWARYAERIADLALAQGDDVTAKDVLFELVTRTEQSPRALTRLAAKIPLPALNRASDYERLAEVLRAAADRGELAALEEGKARWHRARVLMYADDVAGAREETERAIPLLAEDPSLAGEAMISLVHLSWSNWSPGTRRDWLRRAARPVARRNSHGGLVLVVDLTTVLLRFGSADGWAEAAKIPMRDVDVSDRLLAARGLANVGCCAMIWGRHEQAETYLSAALDLARTYEYPHLQMGLAVIHGHLDYFRGRWAGLADRLRDLSACESLQAGRRLEADLVISRLLTAEGRTREARDILRSVLAHPSGQFVPELVMEASAALAEAALVEGRVEEALEATERPFRLLRRTEVWIWGVDLVPVRVRTLLAAGRPEEASDAVSCLAGGLVGQDAPACHASLLSCQAVVAEARSDFATAATLFEQAAAAWDTLPRPYESLRAQEGAARCEVRRARPDLAAGRFVTVLREYSRLGAFADGERIVLQLRDLGVRSRRPGRRGGRTGYGEQLSPREREVIELVAAGRTDTEIASILFKSVNTIRSQVKSAKRKLGVSSRMDLAGYAAAGRGRSNDGR